MRKKSENRSNIIMPLHFGHSIVSSWVVTFTAVSALKQELHQNVKSIYFNSLYAIGAIHDMRQASSLRHKKVQADIFLS
jgi:hypothetical protein